MSTGNRIFDDIGKMMTSAAGVAKGARDEAETAIRSQVERWLADMDLVTREEFDAVRSMAMKAREENEALKARLDALEGKGGDDGAAA
jgi:BMFP domain-containing protein YqiC